MADYAHEIYTVCAMAVIVVKQRANRKRKHGYVDPATKMQLHAKRISVAPAASWKVNIVQYRDIAMGNATIYRLA